MNAKNQYPKLEYNKVYHIYNSGVNGMSIFRDDNDYDKFLSNYEKYIDPIADTYAWSLLGNHFHILIKLKKEENILPLSELKLFDAGKTEILDNKKPDINKQFSHLFNAYTQYYNYKYKRRNVLFERPFKRIEIGNREYFKRCLIYIHQNPVKHGFVEKIENYRYCSFNYLFRDDGGNINKKSVLSFFKDIGDLRKVHQEMIELTEFEN